MENKNKTDKVLLTIQSNEALTDSVYKMVLTGDTKAICVPGQFVNLKLDGFYLRRPISVCDYDENSLTIIYKVVGEGTEKMCTMKAGEVIDTLTGLGNGYDTSLSGDMLDVKIYSKVDDVLAVIRIKFIEELNYPLMFVEEIIE